MLGIDRHDGWYGIQLERLKGQARNLATSIAGPRRKDIHHDSIDADDGLNRWTDFRCIDPTLDLIHGKRPSVVSPIGVNAQVRNL